MLPLPDLQINFAQRLDQVRRVYLREGHSETISNLDITEIDRQLAQYVDKRILAKLASAGLRGEVFLPVPIVLIANPFLLGYYRLLLGYSQKEFYSKGPYGAWKRLEEKGLIPKRQEANLLDFCKELCDRAAYLVEHLDKISLDLAHELQLLTLGPQLRGGQNNVLGAAAIVEFYDLIQAAAIGFTTLETPPKSLELRNKKGNKVVVELASDPDVCITEFIGGTEIKHLAVEIKGGADASNVHNRIGEAEKSHAKAKNNGFVMCWTVLRVRVDPVDAARKSHSTDRFFHLGSIKEIGHPEHEDFQLSLKTVLGIL